MDVIVTHTNTDFDAFAAMLAARRLYPGAVVALSGSLNRNVREFYRLHAEELDVVEPNRVEPAAVTRLIVVETLHPERLGEWEQVARDPQVGSSPSTTTGRSGRSGSRPRTSSSRRTAR